MLQISIRTAAAITLGILFVTATSYAQNPERTKSSTNIIVGWWNVENLFDTVDNFDPLPQFGKDDEFTPLGDRKWTAERYRQKLKNIGEGIRSMGNGRGPDVLGLCETENEQVLRDLIDIELPDLGYDIAYHESPDARGIDVGFIFRKELFSVASKAYRRVPFPDTLSPTRDIVLVELESQFGKLVCIGNHWPSKRGGIEATEWRRIRAAEVCRALVDSVLELDSSTDLIVMGDFNDGPNDRSVARLLHEPSANIKPEHILHNCMTGMMVDSTLGTYSYRGKWEMIDQFIVSTGMFDAKGFGLGMASVHRPEFLKEGTGRYTGSPRPTYGGANYLAGYSDHFPILMDVTVQTAVDY